MREATKNSTVVQAISSIFFTLFILSFIIPILRLFTFSVLDIIQPRAPEVLEIEEVLHIVVVVAFVGVVLVGSVVVWGEGY